VAHQGESADPRAAARSSSLVIGTAGWSIPRAEQQRFPQGGLHLERYAQVLPVAEINSSFHRPHRPELYAKWAAMVPPHFRFSVKVPKAITHELRLLDCEQLLADFLDQSEALGDRRGPLLVQLPPSLEYEPSLAGAFLEVLRALYDGVVVIEPRNATWFGDEAEGMLVEYQVGRVAADPARVPAAAVPGGWAGIRYYRLHGSPRPYWSRYDVGYIEALAGDIWKTAVAGAPAWCIFDNTASGAAMSNALELAAIARGGVVSGESPAGGAAR
jgi:uncharacterized protein YecE (DUF72 family)